MDKTLIKGLKILETLSRSKEPRGVSEIARELNLTKSNIHRLLQTLSASEYVHSEGGKYRLSSKMWAMGAEAISKLDFRRLALDEMQALAESTSETVHLSIYDHAEVIYLEKIDSPQPIRAYTKVGGRAPAHCVATGKVLLAFQSSESVEELLSTLVSVTPQTITDHAKLMSELAEAKVRNYAVNRGEWRREIGGIASAIFDSRGQPVAAIGISGPVTRLTDDLIPHLAGQVKNAADRVSSALGARLSDTGSPVRN